MWVPTPLRGLGDAQGTVTCVAAGRQHTILLDERGAAWLVFNNAKSIGHRAAFGNLPATEDRRFPKVPKVPKEPPKVRRRRGLQKGVSAGKVLGSSS